MSLIHGPSQNLILAALFSVVLCHAQEPTESYIDEARQSYGSVSGNLVKSAEALPAQDYDFRPTATSPTFGQLVSEIAASQRKVCSAIDNSGLTGDGPIPRAKNEYLDALGQSIRKCARAYAFVNNFNASEQLDFGSARHSRLGLLFLNASQCEEVYGRLAVYLRLKGIVPPSFQARFVPVGQ